ncbi:hypothetical protein Tco_1383284 [Tanacetum coccineum]
MSARVAEAATFIPIHPPKKYRSYYETPSPSPSSSPTLPVRKRCRDIRRTMILRGNLAEGSIAIRARHIHVHRWREDRSGGDITRLNFD